MPEERETFVVYGHGWNGDYTFCEPWSVVETLTEAKAVALKAMGERFANALADGTPTLKWMEIFGPGIEESIGLEADGQGCLFWTGG